MKEYGMKEEILTAEEAALYLRVALSTLYRYMQEGKIPCFKVGNNWRFKKSVLDEWIQKLSEIDEEKNMPKRDNKTDKEVKVDVALGLGGIFKGLGNLLDVASDLTEKAEKFQERAAKFQERGKKERRVGTPKGLQAVYGFSVRVGGEGRPIIESFGNVREKAGKGPVVDDVREPITDLLDEEEYFLVVAELPGTEEGDVGWQLKEDILIISAESQDRKYYKELLLPSAVDETRVVSSCKNGILELKLWKPNAA
ncbi:helix-turn-helix domain-containing protein [Acidobacteria bacterium AH-259-G07]|nr:helix-turn-helix domain-containing protein [Acidobacteria bacterium AH-259-G07]